MTTLDFAGHAVSQGAMSFVNSDQETIPCYMHNHYCIRLNVYNIVQYVPVNPSFHGALSRPKAYLLLYVRESDEADGIMRPLKERKFHKNYINPD